MVIPIPRREGHYGIRQTQYLRQVINRVSLTATFGLSQNTLYMMEMIYRRTYGLGICENYRFRVLTHCGWDGIINRVRMNTPPPVNGVKPRALPMLPE